MCASLSAGLLAGCASGSLGGYTPVSESDIERVLDGDGELDKQARDEIMDFAEAISPDAFTTEVVSELDVRDIKPDHGTSAEAVLYLSSMSSTDDPNVFFAVAAPVVEGDADGGKASLLRVDVAAKHVSTVAEFDAPPGYVERVGDEKKRDSTTTKQLARGWSVAQLLTFDDTTNQITRSDDMWAALGGIGIAGAHLNDAGDGFDKFTQTLPVVSSEPYVGLCALETSDDDAALRKKVHKTKDQLQEEDKVENVNSAVATASLIASSGMPALSVLDPVTLDGVSTLVLRAPIDTHRVGLVDTVSMAQAVGTKVYTPDEDVNPIQDTPVTSVVKTGLVAGVTDLACTSAGVANHWGFAVSKRNDPAVLGLVDADVRRSFIRDIIADGNAGDTSLDVAHFNGLSERNHLVVVDSRLGTATGTVEFSGVNDNEEVIAFDVVTGGPEPLIRYVVADGTGTPVRIVDARVQAVD